MSYRGSLRQCITYLTSYYRITQQSRLAIVQMPKAKYYTIMTDKELGDYKFSDSQAEARLIFHGTLRELTQFCTALPVQRELFDDTPGDQQHTPYPEDE